MCADSRDSQSLVARFRTILGALPRAGVLRAVGAKTWPLFQTEGIAKKRFMSLRLVVSSRQISGVIVEILRRNRNRDPRVRVI